MPPHRQTGAINMGHGLKWHRAEIEDDNLEDLRFSLCVNKMRDTKESGPRPPASLVPIVSTSQVEEEQAPPIFLLYLGQNTHILLHSTWNFS